MTQFATARQLSTYLTGTLANASLPQAFTAQAELLIRLVSADVQIAARSTIEAGTGTVYLPGVSGGRLELPQRPVRSVSGVALDGTAVDPSAYEWDGVSVLRIGNVPIANGPAFDGWGGLGSIVAVEYAWGLDDVPDFVLSCVLRACARCMGNPTGIRQETLGPASFTYSVPGDGSHILESERKMLRRAFSRTAGSFALR